ncbi:amino acid/amide ABC transporter ATP-binding protein 2, HAAT family [Clostridium amylolyticum]|uniref:Amino acid/amide ABC transporter ATP-binding protein 2, HAAT family n=1 Tax=Clostridium amylolyticum TaxID=1121298 RepID=A0A1M6IKJ7_9CLOT|nr:ABC transporter ATP-binding protein [Clostridium amylolyticum]SHJ34939.1 amino acid/amide ABC transporter ATP-binding protein 2, HAAT family [Clostridium amylolyticum]
MLKVSDLHVNYGFIKAVKGIDFHIPEGKIVSILGANGAGKTSTLKALSGIVPISKGSIELEDKKIDGKQAYEIVKQGIIHCPEGRKIFPQFTVEENLKVGSYVLGDNNEVKENFSKVYEYFPRLRERKNQIAGTLSGGEQQMLAIGRGLMASPKLFILDEPSLGLAPIIVKEIFQIIKEINKQGVTVLLVEQNAFQTLKIADYVYVLETGNIVLEGTAEVIRNDESVKKSYLGG